jgi:hypothetical protein
MAKTINEKLPNMKQFGDGLTAVQNMIAGVASAVAGSFEEVYENLAGKAISGTLTASSGNWLLDTTVNDAHPFIYYNDVLVDNVDSGDRADVTFWLDDYEVIKEAGVCNIIETLDPTVSGAQGRIRLRSKNIPTTNIRANYWIETPSTS